LPIEHPRAFPTARSPLKRRLQTFTYTPFPNLFHRAPGTSHPFGHFTVYHAGSVFAFVHQQQDLGMAPAIGRLPPPIHQTLQPITLFGGQT
jgi:hypothetical protein